MPAANNPLGRDRAETILRLMHELSVDDPTECVARFIHPEAEMRLLVSYGEPIVGREAIVVALCQGREAETFSADVEGFEWLDPETALTTAHARYALRNGGHGQGRIYWIDQLRDGMVWRVSVFKSEQGARRHYAESRRTTADRRRHELRDNSGTTADAGVG